MIELREMHEPDLKELHAKLILKEEREPDPDLKKESNIYLITKKIKRETDFERRT
jgi:hypothetical protein